MPTRSTYTLLTFRGIAIGVNWTWFVFLFLIILLLTNFYRGVLGVGDEDIQPYLLAVATALLFFGSILLHELGHAIVALRNGIGISHITLWMFGGVAGLERDSDSPGVEFRIAAAGPLVTLVVIAACFGAGAAIGGAEFWSGAGADTDAEISGPLAMLAWLGNINAIILVFNLVPAFPLDGGRIARSIAWKITGDRERATIFAARLGQGFGGLLIGGGVMLMVVVEGAFVWGLWLAVIGWFLAQAASETVVRSQLTRKIGDLRVADVMDTEPVAIPAEASVETALEEYFLRYGWPFFPVVDAGRRFVGLLKRGAADGVPEVSRASRRVRELVDPGDNESQRVAEDARLEDLLGNTELRRLGALAAVDRWGQLTGVVTLEQVSRALRDAVGSGGREAGDHAP
jgi:Zn-dependent protease